MGNERRDKEKIGQALDMPPSQLLSILSGRVILFVAIHNYDIERHQSLLHYQRPTRF